MIMMCMAHRRAFSLFVCIFHKGGYILYNGGRNHFNSNEGSMPDNFKVALYAWNTIHSKCLLT